MHDIVQTLEGTYGLDRQSVRYGQWRRGLRSTIHFLSYHFVLKRRTTRRTRAAGGRISTLDMTQIGRDARHVPSSSARHQRIDRR